MRIVLYGEHRRLGVLDDPWVIDLHRAYGASLRAAGDADPEDAAIRRMGADLAAFIENGDAALDAAEDALGYVAANGTEGGLGAVASEVKLNAPWPRRRIACVGGNYADHLAGMQGGSSIEEIIASARETGHWGFWKIPVEATGPGDDVLYPHRTQRLDYEGEVAIILAKRAKDIRAEDLADHVWGVTLVDDLSIRDDRSRQIGMSYNLAKNFDGSTAIGPAIVVREDLDPSNIDVTLSVNDERRQQFNSSAMIFSFAEVLEFLSTDFTFVPGDIISGGTAKGTAADLTSKFSGNTRDPNELFLQRGDTIELSSPQIGAFSNHIV